MKNIFTFCFIALFAITAQAQLQDVTVTLQPTVSYNWFDDNTAIEDGIMYGGRIGFGFGEAIELRGIYEISSDLNNTVDGFDIFSNEFVNNFNSRNVEVERYGGEFKANIPTRGTFVPFLTLGAGVQSLTVDIAASGEPSNDLKSEQIYASLGLGTQIKLGRRLFLNLEAKNTIFNLNPASVLFQEGQDQSGAEDFFGNNDNTRMYNWSVLAGLQLYLGGRSPEDYSDLDRAYYSKYSGGLGGFKLIVEPAGAFINFDNDTNLADSYFLGGKVGFDLNQYVGLRGYYYRATRNETISTDFDDLEMYGGDFIAKLNVSRGLVPYLTIGGGYLNAYDSYVGKDGVNGGPSGYFAKGGVGINVPLTRNFEAFGDASLMYTSNRDDNDLQNTITPDELRTNTMYTVGVRFLLGKRGDNTDEVLENRIDERVNARTKVYQDRINALESELSEAYEDNDTKKAVAIIEEKKELERQIDNENKMAAASPEMLQSKEKVKESKVILTPTELEELIKNVIEGVDKESRAPQTVNERMDRLERLLLEINTGAYRENLTPVRQEDATQRILDKLNDLDRKINQNTNKIDNLDNNLPNQNQDKTVIITPGQQTAAPVAPAMQRSAETKVTTDSNGNTVVESQNANNGVVTGWTVNQGLSVFTGAVIADDISMIVGIRGNYAFTNSPFKFMPDIYIAPGKDTGFGINANVILPFDVQTGVILNPYVGLGLGYNDAVGVSTFSPNFIVGTSFNVLGGKLFADYTAHNFIDIHQISLGYKLNF
jgi:hypothetical protein